MLLVALLIASIFLAQTQTPGSIPQVRPRTVENKTVTTIPFDPANNLIVINAMINGQGPFRFLLDTGTSHHVLSTELAESLGLQTEGSFRIDVGGKEMTEAESTEVAELRVGGLLFRNQRFVVASLPKAYTFQGFLGAELFNQFVVTLDFEHSLVTLARPSELNDRSPGARIPLKLHDGLIPQVRAEVDGHSGWFKIDTGYNGSLVLFAEFVARHKTLSINNSQSTVYAPGGQTVVGDVGNLPVTEIRVLSLKTSGSSREDASGGAEDAGAITLRNLHAVLFTEKGGSNSVYAGAIGTAAWHSFTRVTFNYSQGLMILQQK